MPLISVIIPVYNSELYIRKAINSVLEQPEDIEIIIIDDGSIDSSFSICENIANENKNIRILRHPDSKNHGRSATRNLGITNAKGNYIAFLDADDYYLPNRFKNDIELLKDESVDGVYNAISAHFYRDFTAIEREKLKLTTLKEVISPKNLFEKIGPIGHFGYFSGIGLTVKKSAFKKTGLFNQLLDVAEDTELWLKMALKINLKSGNISEPVAMRGVHNTNSSFRDKEMYIVNNLRMYESLLNWCFENKIDLKRIDLIWKKVWINRVLNDKKLNSDFIFWISNVVRHPSLLLLKRVYKTFPFFRRIKNMKFFKK
ncbi:glycosyltransferase family 2 protein [Flavobacterium gyeonganense]|uniref:Glycosyltransferase family 2 protein n=1 Tax=Flavobacterium gyeonganense TaxID=1310418 RepID=A0ABV5H992_9FLAO|nr:glycosyltransferase family 2 protein [Flavobacterium gyeonganense]